MRAIDMDGTTRAGRRRGPRILSVALAATLALGLTGAPGADTAHAADGTPDPGFGGDGVVDLPAFDYPSGNTRVGNVLPDGSGRVIVAGRTGTAAVMNRFLSNGDRDTNFGAGGIVKVAGDGCTAQAALLADGRIRLVTVAPRAASDPARLRVYGLLADGRTADTAVGPRGWRDVDAGSNCPSSLAVAGTRLYVSARGGSSTSSTIVALRADGTPDPRFGSGGRVAFSRWGATDTAVLPRGRVVVAQVRSGAARVLGLTAGGAIDTRFATAGVLNRPGATALAVTPTGQLVTASTVGVDGACAAGPARSALVARFSGAGTPDPGFAAADNIAPACSETVRDIGIDGGGRVVVLLQTPRVVVARVTNAGAVDTTFGDQGANTVSVDTTIRTVSLAVRTGGSMVVGSDITVPRYMWRLDGVDPDGSVAGSFGGGLLIVDFLLRFAMSATRVVADGDGLLIAGRGVLPERFGLPTPVALTRLRANGSPDPAFGLNGVAVPNPEAMADPLAVRITAENIIVAMRDADEFGYLYATRTGAFDDGAGRGVRTQPGPGATEAEFDGEGRAVFAFAGGFELVRLNRNASVDSAFAPSITGPCGSTGNLDVTRGGSAIATCRIPGTTTSRVVKVAEDGTLDPGFSGDGILTAGMLPNDADIDVGGRVTLIGLGGRSGNAPQMSRFSATGAVDPTFNGGAPLRLALPTGPMVRDRDGRTLFASFASTLAASTLSRVRYDGSADRTFAAPTGILPLPRRVVRLLTSVDDGHVVAATSEWGTRGATSRLHRFEVSAAALTLDARDVSRSEASLRIGVRVVLNRASTAAVTVDYTTIDGTAVAGEDYRSRSGTLTIPAGTTSVFISVPIIADDVNEPDETFRVVLSNANGAVLGDATAVATIVDDD